MVGLSVALLLPWLLGVAWLRRWLAQGNWPALVGYGYILGILATTLLLRLVDALGLPLHFLWIAAMLAALALMGLWYSRDRPWGLTQNTFEWGRQGAWKWLWGLLFGLIVLRLGGLAIEIGSRPLFPWDAWTTWAVRAQVWFAYKRLIPFVDPSVWPVDAEQIRYTIEAWQYPPAVSLIQLWTALGYGQWDESIINIPWLLCAVALGLGFYGQVRLYNAGPLWSMLFTYLLLSLPILNTHLALAGYADLWMGTVYSLAAIAFMQWLRSADRWQGLLALLLALACPTIKAEGAVWLLTFIPALLVARMPGKKLLWIGSGFGLILVLWFYTGGFAVNLPWLGEIQLTPRVIQIPSLGRFALSFSIPWESFLQNFFALASWHLLWYLFFVAVLIAIPRIWADRLLLSYTVLVISGLLMLFVLFTLTDASLWAEEYTSINRLFLHMVPTLMFYMLLLLNAVGARALDIRLPSAARSG